MKPLKYELTYCCMPHPLYAEMTIDADNDIDAMRKADAVLAEYQITGWYFNEDNVDYRDVELRRVQRHDAVVFSHGFGDDVPRPDHEERSTAAVAHMRKVFGDTNTDRYLEAARKPPEEKQPFEEWHALLPDLSRDVLLAVARLHKEGRIEFIPPQKKERTTS